MAHLLTTNGLWWVAVILNMQPLCLVPRDSSNDLSSTKNEHIPAESCEPESVMGDILKTSSIFNDQTQTPASQVFKENLNRSPKLTRQIMECNVFFTPNVQCLITSKDVQQDFEDVSTDKRETDREDKRDLRTTPANLNERFHALIADVTLKCSSKIEPKHNYKAFNEFTELSNQCVITESPESLRQVTRNAVIETRQENADVNPGECSRPRKCVKKSLFNFEPRLKNGSVREDENFSIIKTDLNSDQNECSIEERWNTASYDKLDESHLQNVNEKLSSLTATHPLEQHIEDVDIGALFLSIVHLSSDLPDLLSLYNYISETVAQRFPYFDISEFKTSGELLTAIFNAYLNDINTKSDPEYELFKLYIKKIQTEGFGARSIVLNVSNRLRLID